MAVVQAGPGESSQAPMAATLNSASSPGSASTSPSAARIADSRNGSNPAT